MFDETISRIPLPVTVLCSPSSLSSQLCIMNYELRIPKNLIPLLAFWRRQDCSIVGDGINSD